VRVLGILASLTGDFNSAVADTAVAVSGWQNGKGGRQV